MTASRRRTTPEEPELAALLNRSSSLPLYYQLQEILKEKIESNVWAPGGSLPPEPELAALFGVSRVVVRQALAILEDDRQIVRVRGRGTLVAAPKLSYRIGGLSRMLVTPRNHDLVIELLDARLMAVEPRTRHMLAAPIDENIIRITTMVLYQNKPLVISYSYFRQLRAQRLADLVPAGQPIPADLTLTDLGVRLSRSENTVETSQCGQFEADRFGIDHRSPVFLAQCREFERSDGGEVPFEVARVECRGDILRLTFDTEPWRPEDALPHR